MSQKPPSSRGRQYAGLSQTERQLLRRQTFLDAGLVVFGEVGFRGATVRKVCAEAGLTDRYFYESFDSMEALLIGVYQAQMNQLFADLHAALQGQFLSAETSALISDGLDVFLERMAQKPVCRVIMLEVLGVSEDVDSVYNGYLSRLAELMLAYMQYKKMGLGIPEQERRLMARSILGGLVHAVMVWYMNHYDASPESMKSALRRMVGGLLFAIRNDN